MPLGIISPLDLQKELENCKPLNPRARVEQHENGRGKGNVEVPDVLRKIIGETSVIDSPKEAVALAEEFGLSRSSVSAYANGTTSTASVKKDDTLSTFLDDRKGKVTRVAMSKMKKALSFITDDKLSIAKATDLSVIARNMGSIVKDLTGDSNEGGQTNNIQFVVHTPPLKRVESYETIEVKE